MTENKIFTYLVLRFCLHFREKMDCCIIGVAVSYIIVYSQEIVNFGRLLNRIKYVGKSPNFP